MFCNKQKTDWDEFLDGVLYAYRTSICVTTGFTPFKVMFGRRYRDFSDFLYRATDEYEEREKKHFIYDTKTLKNDYKQVKENQRKMMLANKAYRDRNRVDIRFQPDDLVLIWDPRADNEGPKKFQFAWSDPAKIVRRSSTSPLLYVVNTKPQEPVIQKNLRKLHVNRLRLYNPFDGEVDITEIERINRAEQLQKMQEITTLPEKGESKVGSG